jgi:hypothetical protein
METPLWSKRYSPHIINYNWLVLSSLTTVGASRSTISGFAASPACKAAASTPACGCLQLLRAGANVHHVAAGFNTSPTTALHEAVLRNNLPVVDILLIAGANPFQENGQVYPCLCTSGWCSKRLVLAQVVLSTSQATVTHRASYILISCL